MLEDTKRVDISYGEVMRHCHLLWEGTLTEANVFALPVVEDAIMNVVLPLNLYALQVCEMAPRRTLSYFTAFQWMCVKRLQELFDQLLNPHVASPMFFGETTVFGRYDEGVGLSGQVDCLPEEVCHWRHPLCWPRLMAWMNEEVDIRECKSVIVKPRVEWALPDVLLMTRMATCDDEVGPGSDADSAESSRKLQKIEMATLTIGLLARKAVDKAEIMERCRHFHELFVSLDAKTRREFGRMTNVLIVCATAYSDDLPSLRSSDEGFASMAVPPESVNRPWFM